MRYLQFETSELPKKEQEALLLAISESESSRKTCLEILSKELQEEQQNDLPYLDEDFLIKFLRTSKFDSSKALVRIKKFFRMQKDFPDYFKPLPPSTPAKQNELKIYASPYRMKDNSMLLISDYFFSDPIQLPINEKFYLEILTAYDLLENKLNQITGITHLVDCKGLTAAKLLHYSPYFMKLLAETIQGALPIRWKGTHFINVSATARILYNIFYPFFSHKMQQRLHVYDETTDWKNLHSYIPPEILPQKYGGHLKDDELINLMDCDIFDREQKFPRYSPLKEVTKL